jgi:ABC-type sugar transport system ATPase subunit
VTTEHMGAETILPLDGEGHHFYAYAHHDHQVNPGDDVPLSFDRTGAVFFDTEGVRVPHGG